MTFRAPTAVLAAAALTAALCLAASPAAQGAKNASVREFKGTVASVAPGGKTFRLRRTGRPAVKLRVVRKTRVAKGARPRKGRKLVVRARRSARGWVARSVKRVAPVANRDETQAGDDDPADDDDTAGEEEEEQDDYGDLDLEETLDDLVDGLPGEEE